MTLTTLALTLSPAASLTTTVVEPELRIPVEEVERKPIKFPFTWWSEVNERDIENI